MKDIHLIQAAQTAPLALSVLETGVPLGRLIDRSGFSLDLALEGEGTLGEYSVWQFFERGARDAGADCLGWNAAFRNTITTTYELGGRSLPILPTLNQILTQFIEFCRTESTGSAHSLLPTEDGVWFRRPTLFGGEYGSWQVELYFIGLLIQVVRICGSADWMPRRLRLCSSRVPLTVPQEWGNVELKWGADATGIFIDEHLLALQPRKTLQQRGTAWSLPVHGAKVDDDQFSRLVTSQIRANRVGIIHAAQQLGISEATLRRRLAAQGTSYKRVLELVRFDLSISALRDTDQSIHDIALDLGYEHQANFTRAFRRQAGLSPRRYRENH